jgi:SNF2 family DNA or RNA helicase
MPAAALVESRRSIAGGEQLQPWQRSFVAHFRATTATSYGGVRLLLADEVGVGKTLSLGACALATAILDPGPILILCPANLAKNWQAELQQHLGIPSAVWLSTQKRWLLNSEGELFGRGVEDVVRCPFRIGIVSTGLLTADSTERALLLERGRFALVILDEAHKARRSRGLGVREPEANNLLDFMLAVARRHATCSWGRRRRFRPTSANSGTSSKS